MGGFVEALDEEWRKRQAAKVTEQQKAADSYSSLQNAVETGKTIDAQADVYKTGVGLKAMAKPEEKRPWLSPSVTEQLTPKEAEMLWEWSGRRGSRQLEAKGTKPQYGKDIEGAIKAGGKREILGGRVSVISPTGKLWAIRDDDPGLGEVWGKVVESKSDTSVLEAAAATLRRPQAALGTAMNYADDPKAKIFSRDFLSDIGKSLAGGAGASSVEAGGLVAGSSSPMADVLNARKKRLLAENPDATVNDLTGGAAGALGIRPEWKLSDVDDHDLRLLGDAVGIVVDPLNLPAGIVGAPMKGAKAAATLLAKGAAKALPGTAEKIGVARKAFRQKLGIPVSEKSFAKAMEESGMAKKEAAAAAERMHAASPAARGSTAQDAVRAKEEIQEAFSKVTKEEAGKVSAIVEEELKHAPVAEIADQIQAVSSDDYLKLPSRRTKDLDVVRGLPANEMHALRQTDQQIQALAAVDAQAAKNLANLRLAVTNKIQPAINQAYHVADDIGLNLYQNLDAIALKHGDNVAGAAKALSDNYNKIRESMQNAGAWGKGVDKNYVPHIVEIPGGSAYTPTTKRTYQATNELDDMRNEAKDFIAHIGTGTLNPADEALVKLFAGDDVVGMIPRRDDFRSFANVDKDRSLGDFAGRIVERYPEASVVTDPVRSFGMAAEKVFPRLAQARLGQAVRKEDFVKSLADIEADLRASGRLKGAATRPVIDEAGDIKTMHGLSDEMKAGLSDMKMHYVSPADDVAKKLPMLRGTVIPDVIYEEITHMAGRLAPESFDKAFGLFGKMLAAPNKLLIPIYLWTSGFHVRNTMYGYSQVYLAVGTKIGRVDVWNKAHEIVSLAVKGKSAMKGSIGKLAKADIADELGSMGFLDTGLSSELERLLTAGTAYKGQIGKKALGLISPLAEKSVPQVITKKTHQALGRIVGMGGRGADPATAENVQRAFVYITRRMAGDTPERAAGVVRKYLFDYTGSSLSDVEKGLRKVIPFYQWIRFSTQQAIDSMLNNPGRFHNIQKVFQMLEDTSDQKPEDPRDVPQYLRARGGIGLPSFVDKAVKGLGKELGFEMPEGKNRYVVMERPGAQLNMFKPSDTVEVLGGSLGPGPKGAIEQLTGNYLFGGQPISPGFKRGDAHNKWYEELLGMDESVAPGYFAGALGGPLGSLASQAAGYKTSPRNTGIEEDEKLLWNLISATLGQRISTFDTKEVRQGRTMADKATLERIQEQMRAKGKGHMAQPAWIKRMLLKFLEEEKK